MLEVIEDIRKDTGLTHSDIMRNIVGDYMVFVKKSLENNHST